MKIAFYWLNASAYRSMAKMKAVAPKVTELRERFKDKPQQMQQEMMRIYREEKVNPLGGCLPIVVQMPFFIALYWVLLSSVEMRNAPWIGWITDLSAKDPWFILPVLMTASSLFQVWLNPTPPDPMQAKMMWFMPLAFGFMFFFFPAGLVLYWLTNNILSIAQQWFINKQLGVLGQIARRPAQHITAPPGALPWIGVESGAGNADDAVMRATRFLPEPAQEVQAQDPSGWRTAPPAPSSAAGAPESAQDARRFPPRRAAARSPP